MKIHVFRLTPGQDLKKELKIFIVQNNIKAGVILTAVGSLQKAIIRMAGAKIVNTYEGKFEVVSLVGTLSQHDSHLHIAFSDVSGNTFGGHLKDGCIIETTMEIVLGELEEYIFTTEPDRSTGFSELKVQKVLPAA